MTFWKRCWRDPLLTIANTPLALVVTLVATLFISAAMFSLLEDASAMDAIYWAGVTMTTTGYGDVTPATAGGKVLSVSLMFWSVFYMLPAAIYHVADRLIHNRDAWTHEEQMQLRADLHDIKTTIRHLAGKETAQ